MYSTDNSETDSHIRKEYIDDDYKYPKDHDRHYHFDNPMYYPVLVKSIINLPNLVWSLDDDNNKIVKLIIDDSIVIPFDFKERKYFFTEVGTVWYSLREDNNENRVSAEVIYYDDILISVRSVEEMHRGIEALIIGIDIIGRENIIEENDLELEEDSSSMDNIVNDDEEYLSIEDDEFYEENIEEDEYYEDTYN